MTPPLLLGYKRPPRVQGLLDTWQQIACAASGLLVATVVFWLGYGAFTGMLSGMGLLTGTLLVALFFTIWAVSWAASEQVACRRIRD